MAEAISLSKFSLSYMEVKKREGEKGKRKEKMDMTAFSPIAYLLNRK
jgi:hypothetical protein